MDDYNAQRQRQKKHRHIMNLIHNYRRSPEEIKNLQKVKANTTMEINLRFLKSHHNRSYKFPLRECEESSDDEFPTGNIVVDLHTQAPVLRKAVSSKVLSLDSSRRVKSLQKGEWDKKRINQFKQKVLNVNQKPPQINQYLNRKNSLLDRKQNLSAVKLPELKKKEKEKKTGLEELIGKKMLTEQSPEDAKIIKYLKNKQKNQKVKKFFLHQMS